MENSILAAEQSSKVNFQRSREESHIINCFYYWTILW